MAFPRVSFRKEIGGIERPIVSAKTVSCTARRDNDVCFPGENRVGIARYPRVFTADNTIGLPGLFRMNGNAEMRILAPFSSHFPSSRRFRRGGRGREKKRKLRLDVGPRNCTVDRYRARIHRESPYSYKKKRSLDCARVRTHTRVHVCSVARLLVCRAVSFFAFEDRDEKRES